MLEHFMYVVIVVDILLHNLHYGSHPHCIMVLVLLVHLIQLHPYVSKTNGGLDIC